MPLLWILRCKCVCQNDTLCGKLKFRILTNSKVLLLVKMVFVIHILAMIKFGYNQPINVVSITSGKCWFPCDISSTIGGIGFMFLVQVYRSGTIVVSLNQLVTILFSS